MYGRHNFYITVVTPFLYSHRTSAEKMLHLVHIVNSGSRYRILGMDGTFSSRKVKYTFYSSPGVNNNIHNLKRERATFITAKSNFFKIYKTRDVLERRINKETTFTKKVRDRKSSETYTCGPRINTVIHRSI